MGVYSSVEYRVHEDTFVRTHARIVPGAYMECGGNKIKCNNATNIQIDTVQFRAMNTSGPTPS